jgi:hypothetical protein
MTRPPRPASARSATSTSSDDVPETLKEFNEQRARRSQPQDDPEYRGVLQVDHQQDEREHGARRAAGPVEGVRRRRPEPRPDLVPAGADRLAPHVRRDASDRNVITTDSGEALQCPDGHLARHRVVDGGERRLHRVGRGVRAVDAERVQGGTLIKISEELLADSAFDLEAYIRDQFGQRIGVLENTGYVAGDGSGKPTGVATQASAGVTAAGAAAITADELIDLFHSLAPPYRRNASFVLNDSRSS